MRAATERPVGRTGHDTIDHDRTGHDTVALLAAASLFLASVEFAIPKPVPFLRLGLANLPVLIAIARLDTRSVALVVALKIVGQGFVQGTLFSYVVLFSAAGSIASAAVMLLAWRALAGPLSLIGVSVLGGLASNAAQVAAARYVAFGPSAWLIAPVFFAVGTVSSALLGAFAERFLRTSRWAAELDASGGSPPLSSTAVPTPGGRPRTGASARPRTATPDAARER